MTASSATIETLPLELMWAILDLIDENGLLNLAKTCHRFNDLAIPCFFQRLNIKQPEPEESVFIRPFHNDHGDQLSGLSADFSLQSMKHLLCILNNRPRNLHEDYGKLSPVEGLERNIQRVNNLIFGLDSIESFCFVFYPMDGFWSLHSGVVQNFMAAFFELLNTTLSRSCTFLRILHPHTITTRPIYQFQLKNTAFNNFVHKGFTKMKRKTSNNELEGERWKYQQKIKYDTVPVPPSPLTTTVKLTTLEINSDFLLLPPFASWTFAVMKQSCITSLLLSLPSVVSLDEFHYYIFPHIVDALPHLEALRLAVPRNEFLVIAIDLLPKLPALRKLSFGASLFGQFPPPSYVLSTALQLDLPKLHAFTGSVDQATYLLGNVNCPNISAVNLIIDDTRGQENFTSIGKKLSTLKDRVAARKIAAAFNVCLSNNGNNRKRPSRGHPLAENGDLEGSFSAVSRLTLELPILAINDSAYTLQMEYVMDWLDAFSGLTALTLTTRQPFAEPTTLTKMIIDEYPNIRACNIVEYPDVFHYHWATAPNDLLKMIEMRPDLSTSRNTSIEGCVCSDF